MSDDTRDDQDDTTSETGGDEVTPESLGLDPKDIPDPSAFGIDPQEMMRNPLGAAFKIMSNPDAMKAFENFMSSPGAQKMVSEGMNNPMIQQLMSNNPMMQQMAQQAQAGGMPPGFGNLFGGGAPAPTPAADEEEEEDEGGIDEPVVALLSSPVPGPAYPETSPVAGFDALLAELPEATRKAILDVADRRVTHHLGAEGSADLAEAAARLGRARPIDLLVGQGAFVGELMWYSIVELEEAHGADAFVPLARYALSLVTQNCGYRVPSFVNQLLAFLVDLDRARPEDIRHAVWALSGQPEDAVHGVFEIEWENVDELLGGLADAGTEGDPIDDRLYAALVVALLGWRELDHSEGSAPDAIIDNLSEGRKGAVLETLVELLGGDLELEGLRGNHLPASLRELLGERLTAELGASRVLGVAVERWRTDRGPSAWIGVLRALDVDWHDADEAVRGRFMARATGLGDSAARHLAFRIGAAWEPHEWLPRAAEDRDAAIRTWAEEELKTL